MQTFTNSFIINIKCVGVENVKRLVIFVGIISVLLVGCGENEYEKDLREAKESLAKAEAYTKELEEASEQIDETTDLIEDVQEEMGIEDDSSDNELDETEIKEVLEYVSLSEEDNLKDFVIENNEIKATIEIGDNSIIGDKSLLAEVMFSSAGDELLQREGWDILTIEFVDVGIVSMHRDEKESNEYGDYFPTDEILKQLGNY